MISTIHCMAGAVAKGRSREKVNPLRTSSGGRGESKQGMYEVKMLSGFVRCAQHEGLIFEVSYRQNDTDLKVGYIGFRTTRIRHISGGGPRRALAEIRPPCNRRQRRHGASLNRRLDRLSSKFWPHLATTILFNRTARSWHATLPNFGPARRAIQSQKVRVHAVRGNRSAQPTLGVLVA